MKFKPQMYCSIGVFCYTFPHFNVTFFFLCQQSCFLLSLIALFHSLLQPLHTVLCLLSIFSCLCVCDADSSPRSSTFLDDRSFLVLTHTSGWRLWGLQFSSEMNTSHQVTLYFRLCQPRQPVETPLRFDNYSNAA